MAARMGSSFHDVGESRRVNSCSAGKAATFGKRTLSGSTRSGPIRIEGAITANPGCTHSRDSPIF